MRLENLSLALGDIHNKRFRRTKTGRFAEIDEGTLSSTVRKESIGNISRIESASLRCHNRLSGRTRDGAIETESGKFDASSHFVGRLSGRTRDGAIETQWPFWDAQIF